MTHPNWYLRYEKNPRPLKRDSLGYWAAYWENAGISPGKFRDLLREYLNLSPIEPSNTSED